MEDLIPLLTKHKHNLSEHLKKNYKLNYHYIIKKTDINKGNSGGHNKINFFLTEYTYELLKNSFNLRNKYITNINDNKKVNNQFVMCIENQTIGFIQNSFKNSVETHRQYIIGNYKVDLYFPNYNLVIECDENNHSDRNPIEEKKRQEYILSQENFMIRFNPNHAKFDLSFVIQEINKVIFSKHDVDKKVIYLP